MTETQPTSQGFTYNLTNNNTSMSFSRGALVAGLSAVIFSWIFPFGGKYSVIFSDASFTQLFLLVLFILASTLLYICWPWIIPDSQVKNVIAQVVSKDVFTPKTSVFYNGNPDYSLVLHVEGGKEKKYKVSKEMFYLTENGDQVEAEVLEHRGTVLRLNFSTQLPRLLINEVEQHEIEDKVYVKKLSNGVVIYVVGFIVTALLIGIFRAAQ